MLQLVSAPVFPKVHPPMHLAPWQRAAECLCPSLFHTLAVLSFFFPGPADAVICYLSDEIVMV